MKLILALAIALAIATTSNAQGAQHTPPHCAPHWYVDGIREPYLPYCYFLPVIHAEVDE